MTVTAFDTTSKAIKEYWEFIVSYGEIVGKLLLARHNHGEIVGPMVKYI